MVYKEPYNEIVKNDNIIKYITKNGTTIFKKMQLW